LEVLQNIFRFHKGFLRAIFIFLVTFTRKPPLMASKRDFVGCFVKFYKKQWGEQWAKETYGDQYQTLFDWVELHSFVAACKTGKKRTEAAYRFNLGKGKNYHISEAEVLEAKSRNEVLGMYFICV
jgi:hypothetical protein